MKRVLVVGPKINDFDAGYNTSIARAFESLGFVTKVMTFPEPSPPDFLSRILIDGLNLFRVRHFYKRFVEKFNRELRRTYDEYEPNIVFVLKGSKVVADTLGYMSQSFNILWCYDLVSRSGIDRQKAELYSKVYCFEQSDLAWVKNKFEINAGFLPMGYDPNVFFPEREPNRDIDVFFIGAYYPNRRKLLEELAQSLPEYNLRFYGRHIRYKEPNTWLEAFRYFRLGWSRVFTNKNLNASQVNDMYNRSKICLNIHHEQSKISCNPRVFEIAGAGAVQLSDSIPYFEDIDFITTYENGADAVIKIKKMLKNNEKLLDNSRRSLNWAVENHTFESRLKTVLEENDLLIK